MINSKEIYRNSERGRNIETSDEMIHLKMLVDYKSLSALFVKPRRPKATSEAPQRRVEWQPLVEMIRTFWTEYVEPFEIPVMSSALLQE